MGKKINSVQAVIISIKRFSLRLFGCSKLKLVSEVIASPFAASESLPTILQLPTV
jgi:hypothetical protein